jgi:DNA-binding MarR family transcriptional regulator
VERDLEPALSFLRELWALDHALGSTSKRMHDRMGVTAQQRMVLRFIGKYPGMTARELADLLYVEKSTLSLALARLEARGLVARKRDPSDTRKALIVLTAAGKELDRPTVGTVERAVERALEASGRTDVASVRRFFALLARLLDEEDCNARARRATEGKRRSK